MGRDKLNISSDPNRSCLHTYSKRLAIFLFVFGCVLFIPSLFLMKIFQMVLNQHLVVEQGSELAHMWQKPSEAVPITIAYNLFNYTNHEDAIKGSKLPVKWYINQTWGNFGLVSP